MKANDFFTWNGRVGRTAYVVAGLVGFAIKNTMDRLLASFVFDRPWSLSAYWFPNLPESTPWAPGDHRIFLLTLLGTALPFIWVGVVMTLKRLRDAGLPLNWVVLFFVPFVNLLFFLWLSLRPSSEALSNRSGGFRDWLDRVMPREDMGAAVAAVVVSLLLGAAGTVVSVYGFAEYGWGLFVGLPFALGLVAALLSGYRHPQSLGECLGIATVSVALLGAFLLLAAIEGFVCLVMAAPLGFGLAWFGAAVGYMIQRRPSAELHMPVLLVSLAAPLMFGTEARAPLESPLFEVATAIEVDAPPSVVWENVVRFHELEEPKDWVFRYGIAYPVRARIVGSGASAVRYCEFSTGSFVEPIEVWDAPRRLGFAVDESPAPMKEWSFYREIHAPHLEGFLDSKWGEFLLEELPDGGTRIVGTTWYRHNMWPAAYWRVISDAIIHRIHRRVLTHVKASSELGVGAP